MKVSLDDDLGRWPFCTTSSRSSAGGPRGVCSRTNAPPPGRGAPGQPPRHWSWRGAFDLAAHPPHPPFSLGHIRPRTPGTTGTRSSLSHSKRSPYNITQRRRRKDETLGTPKSLSPNDPWLFWHFARGGFAAPRSTRAIRRTRACQRDRLIISLDDLREGARGDTAHRRRSDDLSSSRLGKAVNVNSSFRAPDVDESGSEVAALES